ncbi:MAG: hypothetical protein RR497_03295 [Oscillospiraceae bacterium]
MQEEIIFDQQDVNSTKSLAWLSYLGLFLLIPMLANKNSPFTKFHVNQGLVLLILMVIEFFLSVIVKLIPIIGTVIGIAMDLALLALMIYGIVNAVQGKAKRLPLIGNIELYR